MSETEDTKTEVCRYPRHGIHDTPEEWIEAAKELDKVVLLDTENDAVFAYYVETDEFDDGYTWRTNAIDPDTGRRVTAHTSDGLVERRFEEAVSKHRAFLLDPEETPLREDRYVAE